MIRVESLQSTVTFFCKLSWKRWINIPIQHISFDSIIRFFHFGWEHSSNIPIDSDSMKSTIKKFHVINDENSCDIIDSRSVYHKRQSQQWLSQTSLCESFPFASFSKYISMCFVCLCIYLLYLFWKEFICGKHLSLRSIWMEFFTLVFYWKFFLFLQLTIEIINPNSSSERFVLNCIRNNGGHV